MAARTLTLDDLFAVRSASDPNLSPDGATVAFVVSSVDRDGDRDRSAIWTVPAEGGEPVQRTLGDADTQPRWAPDGRSLAFVRGDDQGRPQVWVLPMDGGEARSVTSLPLGVTGYRWSPDGTRLAVLAIVDIEGEPEDDADKSRRAAAPLVIRTLMYKSDGAGLLGSRRVHLHVVDARTGQTDQITKDDLSVGGVAWSPDGSRIAYAALLAADRDTDARSRLFVADATGGGADEVARWDGSVVAPAWGPDPERLAFIGMERAGSYLQRLWTVASDGGAPEEVAPGFDRNVMPGGPAYPGAMPVWCDDGRIRFCARDRGCTHVYVVDAAGGSPEKVVGGDDRVVSGMHTVDGGRITTVIATPGIPSDVFLVDGPDERRLTSLSSDLLDGVAIHEPAPRTFTAPDGTELHGWVVRGDGPGPQPLLVDIHGGPHNAWSPAWGYATIRNEVLAAQGWSVLLLNPRGSDGYGEAFFRAALGGWGERDEQDFLAAIDALVADGTADPDRLAVTGYSYGGYMTNWLAARTGRFKAAVSGGCVADETSMFGTSDVGPALSAFEFGSEPHADPELFTRLSPLTYAAGVAAPMLILHGENDDRCPVGQAEQWFATLKRLGAEVELVRYPGASHLFIVAGRPSHRLDYSERVIDWVMRHTSR